MNFILFVYDWCKIEIKCENKSIIKLKKNNVFLNGFKPPPNDKLQLIHYYYVA